MPALPPRSSASVTGWWLRHAKAGEACERFVELHLVRGDEIVETVPTYRGDGHCFG